MKIVHLSDRAISAAPYRLAQVQRLGGLDARLVSHLHAAADGTSPRTYPYDLLTRDDPELLRHVLAEADVVHHHDQWRDSEIFRAHPWAWEIVRDKPSVIQFHLPRRSAHEKALSTPSLTKLVVAQYHVRLYPECIPVPNAIPLDDPLHRSLGVENDPPIVAYTPPNCERKGWWDKGCAETRAILAGFRHRFVTEAPWERAMALRQPCDIAIDEVVTGSYHMCSLEALSQGLATIARLDEQTVDALERITGTRSHPWIVATLDTLHRRLTELSEDAEYRRAKRAEGRAYMERHWNVDAITRRFAEIYTRTLERAA